MEVTTEHLHPNQGKEYHDQHREESQVEEGQKQFHQHLQNKLNT